MPTLSELKCKLENSKLELAKLRNTLEGQTKMDPNVDLRKPKELLDKAEIILLKEEINLLKLEFSNHRNT